MPQGWSSVFRGPLGEAAHVRALLEQHGIPVFEPEDAERRLVPLEVEGGLLDAQRELLVPESALARARKLLAEHAEREPAPGEVILPAGFFAPDASGSPAHAEAAAIGRRLRWASALALLAPYVCAPFALSGLVDYWKAARDLDPKPASHRWTIAAGCLWPIGCVPYVLWWYLDRRGGT